MPGELENAALRYAVFARQVLEPAIFPLSAPVDVAVFQAREPLPYREAIQARYEPAAIGWRWGPAWSTAWFRIRGIIPRSMAGRPVVLRFSSGTEALLWDAGVPRQGLDPNRELTLLADPAEGQEEVHLYVEAACNHPDGIIGFALNPTEYERRWAEALPGRLERCEVAVLDRTAWRLWHAYEFARQLLLLLPDDAARGQQLNAALRQATLAIDEANVSKSAPTALANIEAALRGTGAPSLYEGHAIGLAHIDTAWLWPIRETRRKCLRAFSNVLRLMEQHADLCFLATQPQQYVWAKHDSPELFAQIAARIREKRWEVGGATWVEPDCNAPSGESLVRQLLHGQSYWRENFPELDPPRCLVLPDTFGFPASLPQIMALAGLDIFITNKMAWCDTNEFPYVSFRWRGIDGTEVLSHFTPGTDYNNRNTPAELRRYEQMTARRDRAQTGMWLQTFGFGDGGGGPSEEQIANLRLGVQCEGLPKVTMSTLRGFREELIRRRETLRGQGRDLPIWDGEFYLEYHRGTLTSQAWLKQANCRAEEDLRLLECLVWAAPAAARTALTDDLRRQLDTVWKLVLLNQFHDILPGSSITWVYEDARRQYQEIQAALQRLMQEAVDRHADAASTEGLGRPAIVFNAASTSRSGVVEIDGQPAYVAEVPANGWRIVDLSKPRSVPPVSVRDRTLANDRLSVEFDEAGRVVSLRDLTTGRDACARDPNGRAVPINQLVLYDDRPRRWEAWDIDAEYEEKAELIAEPAEKSRIVEAGPLRGVIEVSRPLGRASHITQQFILTAGSPRLDIRTRVDWREERKLLRVLFPVDVRARTATGGIQFGHLERATHRNTRWERARFEFCTHGWLDLSEPGFGFALLSVGILGHSCHHHVLGLSLLRGPRSPDPQADIGVCDFTYSLLPHQGDWRAANVDREAEALRAPLFARSLAPEQNGTLHGAWAPFTISTAGAMRVAVAAVKLAERDDRLIVRLVNLDGGRGIATIAWHMPVKTVEAVNLLEQPWPLAEMTHDAPRNETVVPCGPFQIITLAISKP